MRNLYALDVPFRNEGESCLHSLSISPLGESRHLIAFSNPQNFSRARTAAREAAANAPTPDASLAAVQAAVDRLQSQREELSELWAKRKVIPPALATFNDISLQAKLELALRVRVFERDALEVSEPSHRESYKPIKSCFIACLLLVPILFPFSLAVVVPVRVVGGEVGQRGGHAAAGRQGGRRGGPPTLGRAFVPRAGGRR